MKRLRVLVLVHEDLVPPADPGQLDAKAREAAKVEINVCEGLRALGHEVVPLGLRDDLVPIRRAQDRHRAHIAFNLLEEFRGEGFYDHHIVAYLELLGLHYTGNSPRGLLLARDKALAKKILAYHRIPVPRFAVFPRGGRVRRPARLDFPLFVKSVNEDASLGISRASIVEDEHHLVERVTFVHETIGTAAIAESYIAGRELYVGVLGNRRLEVLPTWELNFGDLGGGARIATSTLKWDKDYQARHGVSTAEADLPPETTLRLAKLSKRIYRALDLSGYARLDFRLDAQGNIYLIEANPNPNLAADEDVARAAAVSGRNYPALLQKIVELGLRRR